MTDRALPTPVDVYVHVPAVVLVGVERVELGDARLVELPFESWARMEDPAMLWHERRYTAARPAFLHRHGAAPADADGCAEAATSLREAEERLAAALLETCGPVGAAWAGQSAAYVRYPEHHGVARFFGVAEREMLLQSRAARQPVDGRQAGELARVYARLIRAWDHGAGSAIRRMASAATLGVRRGTTVFDVEAHVVAAIEDLLESGGRPATGELKASFARRASRLLARTFEEIGPMQEAMLRLYARRSEFLHGAVPATMADESPRRPAIELARRACELLTDVAQTEVDLEASLGALVRRADAMRADDRAGFEALRAAAPLDGGSAS